MEFVIVSYNINKLKQLLIFFFFQILVMDGSLPKSLRHVISNAEYYGPSLFLLATDVVTVYVFQEPSLLSSLQESGLTDVLIHALLVKEVKQYKLKLIIFN